RLFPRPEATRGRDRMETEGDEPWLVERRDSRVLVIVGVPAEEREKRAARMWSETTFAPSSPTLDLDLAMPGGSSLRGG
ncbi:MAG: hypothetical protein ACREQY_23025, partial [Candidatus Binatia bacterium]